MRFAEGQSITCLECGTPTWVFHDIDAGAIGRQMTMNCCGNMEWFRYHIIARSRLN